jgi:hypothetical protein
LQTTTTTAPSSDVISTSLLKTFIIDLSLFFFQLLSFHSVQISIRMITLLKKLLVHD